MKVDAVQMSNQELVRLFSEAQRTMALSAALRLVISENDRRRRDALTLTAYPVIDLVAALHNTTRDALLGRQDGPGAFQLGRPRVICWWLLHYRFGMSYPALGEAFSGRDHSTVLRLVARFNHEVKRDEDLRQQLSEIEAAAWGDIGKKAA